MRNSNDSPEVFSSYASLKSCSEIAVWMPWPLNCDLEGGATWPNHFCLYTMRCRCTEAQEMRAPCMFDWQGTQTFFSRSGMLNPKFGLSCVHCVIQISQLLLSCVHCVIQIAQFVWSFNLRTLLSCENSLSLSGLCSEHIDCINFRFVTYGVATDSAYWISCQRGMQFHSDLMEFGLWSHRIALQWNRNWIIYISSMQLRSKHCTVYYYPDHSIHFQFCTHSAFFCSLGSIPTSCHFTGTHMPTQPQ